MKELREYRASLIDRLQSAAAEFRTACEAALDPFAEVEAGGWNVHQLAAHTREVDKVVYSYRARQTVEMDNPVFKNYDAEEWMVGQYDPQELLAEILGDFTNNVSNLAEWLRGLPAEAWNRKAKHEAYGSGFTTQSWVERDLAHIEEHLKSVVDFQE